MGHLTEFHTLEAPTRWMSLLAAVLAPIALLTMALPHSMFPVMRLPGSKGILPSDVLWVGVVIQAIGWWYLLAGSASAPAWLRWVSVSCFALMQLFANTVTPLVFLSVALTIAFPMLTKRGILRGPSATAFAGLTVALFFLLLYSAGWTPFAKEILTLRVVFYVLALPMVFYSGVDLGETGLFLTRLGLWHLHPRIAPRALWWIALALVGAKLAYMLHLYPNDWSVLALLALLALGGWITNRLRTHGEPPDYVLLGMSLAVFVFGTPFGRVGMAIVAVAAALIMGFVSRRRGRTAATIGLFLLIVGLWLLSGATEYSFDEAITIAALSYLVYLRIRGPLRVERVMLVLFWLVGFTIVSGTYDLLSGLHDMVRGAQVATTLLLTVAVIHDIAGSGTLLNHGSETMTRPTRVLMYLGYMLLAAGTVVLSNGPTGGLALKMDIGSFQLYGLLILGIPLFLQQVLHAFHFGHRPEMEVGEDGEEPSA